MIPRSLYVATALLLAAAVAMAGYLIHLRRESDREQQRLAQLGPLAPPSSGQSSSTVLIVANDAHGTLDRREVTLTLPAQPAERLREQLRALFGIYLEDGAPHQLGDGSEIKNLYLVGDDAVVLDLNAEFADAHPSGIMAETLTIESILRTIVANDAAIKRVKILVDGQERESLAGHVNLKDFFETLGPQAAAVQ
jgi:Sporulation and spore germination